MVVGSIKHQQVREFWFFEFEKYSAWLKSEAVSPILNKIGQFLTSIPLRNIVGQKENTFYLRKVMDEGKILIVNLAKGKIGEDNASLLGAMMVTRIMVVAFLEKGKLIYQDVKTIKKKKTPHETLEEGRKIVLR